MRYFRKRPITLIIFGTLIYVIIILFLGKDKYGSTFIQDFTSNWLSTLLGLIVGIPIALWINRWQEQLTEKERKLKILHLLKEELVENQTWVTEWLVEQKLDEVYLMYISLRDEVWNALSDGGELQWIKDPELLGYLADAFSAIRKLREISSNYFFASIGLSNGMSAIHKHELLEHLKYSAEFAHDFVRDALLRIEKEFIA